MKRLLIDRALWKVVSGEEVLADNAMDKQKKAFKEKDEKALTQLIICVGNTQIYIVEKATTSKEAWDSLCNTFESKSLVNSLFLQQALHNTKFNNGDKTHMERYIAELISIAEKLRSIGTAIDDHKVALIILESLPQSYSPLIMRLESQSKTLTFDLVKSCVLHEAKKRIATSKTKNVFAAEQRYSNFRRGAAQGPSKQYSSSQSC